MPSYLITGASRGIGLEFVRQLSTDTRNTVFALVRNNLTADQLLAIRTPNVHILEADITDHVAVKKAADETAKITGGSLDVLINNAAFIDRERHGLPLDRYGGEDVLAHDLRMNFEINTIGVIFTINAFLPLLKCSTVKKVISLSSAVGDLNYTLGTKWVGHAPYSISKAALNMVNVKYAVEYQNEGFTFLAISPGLVSTSTASPTPARLETYDKLLTSIKRIAPDFEGALTTEESVKLQLEVINKVTVADTGAFVSQYGSKRWV